MMFKHYKNDKEFEQDKVIEEMIRNKAIEKVVSCIEDILQQPFEGKTDKQKWQRKGMEEGLRMTLEICKEIMEGGDDGK